jgi:cysteine dioxygenase
MATAFDALFHFLDGQAGRPAMAELAALLARLEFAESDLAPFIHFSDRQYQRNLVKAGSSYHVWVLCWKAGQRSPIHDHGNSVCGVRVLRGTATVTHFARTTSGHIKAIGSEEAPPGSVLGTVDSDLHQVSNLQDGGADLVTLHVYTPPLLRMGTYSILDTERGVDVWTEWIEGAGI